MDNFMRGPFPILTTPYHADGAVDAASLARSARFVADAGCPGVIWCQSGDAVDLLTFDEKRRGYETLAAALEGRDITLTLGCNGEDAAEAVRAVEAAEAVAAAHPTTRIALISRPPDGGRTLDDVRAYYEAVGAAAKRPVIIQTFVNAQCPIPTVGLLIDLAKRFPGVFGYVKVESGDEKTNQMMADLAAAKPVIRTVFSGWGGWQWLFQTRRCGSEGVISERCAYAPLFKFIWDRMENGDRDGRLMPAFAIFRLLADQRFHRREEMRGYGLHYLKRLGLFETTVTRQYKNVKTDAQGVAQVDPEKDRHEWVLEDLVLDERQMAELDVCYDEMMRFLADSPAVAHEE